MRSSKRQAKEQAKRQAEARRLREQARDLRTRARELTGSGLDERATEVAEQAAELAERLRSSEAMAKAQAKGGELVGKARTALQEAGIDERAAQMAQRVRESERYKSARAQAGDATDRTLSAVGTWLARGPAADKLGVRPADEGRRRSGWLWAAVAAVAGFAAGIVAGARNKEKVDELGGAIAERIGQGPSGDGVPLEQLPVADEVRARLGEDPRTSSLPQLNVNVAEGTVFVRGSVPEGTDEDAIRSVVGTVPGVEDVDLQLSTEPSGS